jgi:hypothetical protein
MIKRFIPIIFLVAVLSSPTDVTAQALPMPLSPEATISLLTCSPGEDLYSVFGHSAIRVKDPLQELDWVYGYGTFDFSDPNFYTNFVRGKLNYKLSVDHYQRFEYQYIMEGRWIWEQELNITTDEKQFLFDSLRTNYLPENRYYLYDFFFDNCATRIRDIFYEAVEREITFDYQPLEHGKSFRELLMPYLTEKPWAGLGINLALGLPADRTATPWNYMFLPDHMMTVFGSAGISSGNEITDFTADSEILLEGKNLPGARFRYGPLWVFIFVLLAAIFMSYHNLHTGKTSFWFDRLLFGATGLLGLLLTFLWFGTDHHVTAWNLNILWALPFHLIMVFFFSGKYSRLLKYYFMINLTLLIIVILSWPLLPQSLPWMVIPLVTALLIRSAVILKNLNPEILVANP